MERDYYLAWFIERVIQHLEDEWYEARLEDQWQLDQEGNSNG